MTGKLFGRSEPVRMGDAAVSPDGWFYHPDDAGPVQVVEDGSGKVVQQFRTGNARHAPSAPIPRPERPSGATPRAPERASGGFRPRLPELGKLPSEVGSLQPTDAPCSFEWARQLCGGRVIGASQKGAQIVIEGELLPEPKQPFFVNVAVRHEGVFRSVSARGALLAPAEKIGDSMQFTFGVAEVLEHGLDDAWRLFLQAEALPPDDASEASE